MTLPRDSINEAQKANNEGLKTSLVDLVPPPQRKQDSVRTAQNGASDIMPASLAGGDRAGALPSVASPQAEKTILQALNGGRGVAPMDIPKGTNQLVVVTSNNWTDQTGQLRVFERDPSHGGTWHANPKMNWPVNLGDNGMGWGGGGLITTPKVTINGRDEYVGGPREMPDGSLNKEGRPKKDMYGHAIVEDNPEGDPASVAGLYKLGFAWGTDRDGTAAKAPSGTNIPYLHLDPFYRAIPEGGQPVTDEQGRNLNGQIIRNLDPAHGRYELYNPQTGDATPGSLSPSVMKRIAGDHSSEYHLLNRSVEDTDKTPLNGKLVKLTDMEYTDKGLPIFKDDKTYSYTSIDPLETDPSKRVKSGTVNASAAQNIWRDSDYFWGDQGDVGRKITGKSPNGDLQLDPKPENLYNVGVRIVNPMTGLYAHIDPASGKEVNRGIMDHETMQHMADNDENMAHELYGKSIVIRQNAGQHPDWGSAYFVHWEFKDVEHNQPSGTGGCTAMSQRHLDQLIGRLQPNAMLLQGPIGELETIRRGLRPGR